MSLYKQEYDWEIVPLETPAVRRACHKCKKKSLFGCSGKFRMNAQQKNVDVWLIYKCRQCDSTWNLPVLTRVHPLQIDAELYEAFAANDSAAAWRYAFDLEQLRRHCNEIDTDIAYEVRGERIVLSELSSAGIRIRLRSRYAFDLRLDKLLKRMLGISNSQLLRMIDKEAFITAPPVNIKKYKLNGTLEILLDTWIMISQRK